MGIENYPKPLIKELGSDDVPSILLDPSRTFADFEKINFTSSGNSKSSNKLF